MGFEPTTLSLAKGCYCISVCFTTSDGATGVYLYRLQLFHDFSPRWYKIWYSKFLPTVKLRPVRVRGTPLISMWWRSGFGPCSPGA